ncbi:MAG: hypothetical protein JRH06_03410 [Deltaproteobacteria bacterium]|nr:hypothetical protein [Deltaproteobacteria bacterium]MBW2136585.1 hypothetical protein [Deltaproteobacteria bacterium]
MTFYECIKIAWAESCYRDFGEILRGDPKLEQWIADLNRSIRASHRAMEEAGIREICRSCEKEDGGSCCGKGMERKYDGPLLLINLLLGQDIPKTRQNPRSCLFLGTQGCLLPARHVICINYLCAKITDRINPDSISMLRDKEGQEIEYLFLVKERILNLLRIHGGRDSPTCSHPQNRKQFISP